MLLQILKTIKDLDPEIKALSDDMGELGKNSQAASGGTVQLSKTFDDIADLGAVWYLNETQVAGYYRAWQEVATKHGAYLMPWCGFDYEPGIAPFSQNSNQLFFGLYATDYRLKANGEAFRDGAAAAIKLKISSLPVIKECRRKDK